MKATVKEENFKKKEQKLKRSTNRFLYTILAIFILGNFFFFSSKLWLPESYTGVTPTPMGEIIVANNREITLSSWSYSEEDKKMEIMVAINNLAIDGIEEYQWVVRSQAGICESKVVMQEDDFVVIVAAVNPGWRELSLTMSISDKDKKTLPEWQNLKLYTNDKVVAFTSHIKDKSMMEYRKAAVSAKIATYEKAKNKILSSIKKAEKRGSAADKKIRELNEKKKYQTDEEIKVTDENISQLEDKKKNIKKDISEKNKDIKEYEDKIKIQKKLLDKLNKGE